MDPELRDSGRGDDPSAVLDPGDATDTAMLSRRGFVGGSLALSFLAPAQAKIRSSPTTYYVDSARGDDAHPGTTPDRAWRSLAKLGAADLVPGDTILLCSGGVWREPLRIRRSGSAAAPIVVGRYGSGPLPKIAAGGVADNTIELVNVEHVHVGHLDVSNHGDGEAERRGVLIAAENIGTLRDIRISDLYIHDVNGSNAHKDTGGITFRTIGSRVPSRFDGLRIERNIIWRVDRSAISGQSDEISLARWFPSLNVVIADNYAEDIGGDGIVPWATDGALVEHNIVRRCVQRAPGGNAGIWPWSADNTLLQLNESACAKGTFDGEGFDSDFNSRNSTFRYNYSHNNDGGFMLICTPADHDPADNIGTTGTVIEWNISRHDHARLFNLSGADDSLVAHNAFYIAPGDDVQALLVSEWHGWSRGATFRDNLFDAGQGTARYGHQIANNPETGGYTIAAGWGPARDIRFENNRYLGRQVDRPDDPSAKGAAGYVPASIENWSSPAFDCARPNDYPAFIARHRAWMMALFEKQFRRPVRLARPVPLNPHAAPGKR